MDGVQMSDTPISDSTPHNVADLGMLCRRLERELNATNERIKRLEEDSQRLNWLLNRGLAWRDCYNDWWKEGEWLYASQSALEIIDKAKEVNL
jgi:predicted nuclease with TOPRIM domain